MKIKELAGNTIIAFASQGFSFLISVLTSLLVPKVLGVDEFGYWQLFLFYASYTGFFSFGIADGMYLIEGGKSRGEIDKRKVNSALWFGLAYEIPIAVAAILACALAGLDKQREFVVTATAVYLAISYAWSALGYVFQALNETRLYSFAVMANKLAFLVPLTVLLIMKCTDFRPFVVFYIASHCCSLAYCSWKGRDILLSGLFSPVQTMRVGLSYIKVGIKLMFANIASMLILGVARFLIDIEWGIEAFGKLSFSLSLVNFYLAFVSQASMVLFPVLRQSDSEERLKVFVTMREALTVVLPAAYLLCFPMIWLIGMWLPQYKDSLKYFVYLLPLCVFDGKMNLLGTTFFKVLRREKTLLAVNMAAAFLSIVGALVGVYALGNVDAVIFSVVVSLAFRSLLSEELISRQIGDKRSWLPVGEVALSVVFVSSGACLNDVAAMSCYLIAYGLFLFFFRKETNRVISTFKRLGRVWQ